MLNIDQEFVEQIRLEIGNNAETISVEADSVQVNTTDIQLANVVDSHQITELPLIGRAFTALEQIEPGVQGSSDRFGTTFSVNGAQPQQSSYIINGADSNDLPLNTIAIQPNIDAIQQFNLITGPLNAEYDRNSGAVVSTAIKQGTNSFHGDAFEFYRDTFLNTRNYFQKAAPTPTFHQNIYGGTLGGPILKDKLFVFGAYEGFNQAVPQAGGNVNVFTPNQLGGNFGGDLPATRGARPTATQTYGAFTRNVIPGTIAIPGCSAGETFAQCAYDRGGNFDPAGFNSISTTLLKQFNVPSSPSGTFTFSPTQKNIQSQYIGRFDFNPNTKDQFYFVGIYQQNDQTRDLPFTGATLPGFGDKSRTVIHQFSAGYTRQLSATALNDFSVHYTRFNFDTVEPQNIVQPSSLGFSITPQNQAAASVPTIAIQNLFTLGFSTNGPQPRNDQVYQLDDNFSKTLGHHNLKFGYDGRKYTVTNPFYARNSGSFGFSTASNPSTSGDAGLDFLLGAPASYAQGSGARIDAYAFLNYLYAQDDWKVTDSLTLNYGLGYQIDTPLHNLQFGGIGVTCFTPGQQSNVFATAPRGLNYPGDPGCNNASGATTRYSDFGPRIGFAYAPNLGFLSGGNSRKLSIRGGYGIYYNRTEEESQLQNLSDPPFGLNSSGAGDTGATNPGFANPYQDLNTGATIPNRFPFIPPTAGTSPSYARFLPFGLSQTAPGFRSPYSENFQLTVERELVAHTIARVSYVGTLGRHNQIEIEGNPETQAGHDACLANPTCNTQFRNTQSFQFPGNTQFGVANPSIGPGATGLGLNNFVSIGEIATEGASNYHSLQVSADKTLSRGLQFQVSYTLSHSLDNASSFEGAGFGGANGRGYNQFNTRLNYGNSSFDVRHRFVFAPVYVVPYKHGGNDFSPINLLASGWQISGILTLATGFPFDISYAGASSLSLYCSSSESYYACPDVPTQTAPLVRANPRQFFVNSTTSAAANRTVYFQPTSFAPEPLGSFGNIGRNTYHGPGSNNTNFIIAKNFALSSDNSRYLQLRLESDNVFNHTQFANPNGSISGVTFGPTNAITNPNTLTFGEITSAAAGRQTQLAAKIYF